MKNIENQEDDKQDVKNFEMQNIEEKLCRKYYQVKI